ncbi:MAG: 30S ribosomal protein S20 [Spirochaetes bacterium RBG_13_51_14]|nr:MAG: 30S ribosomal protein S20 [Spirochaetes bacterium RBG_13_51_14]
MANLKSQIKRNKQNEKRRARNSQEKSSIRTISKKVAKAIDAKDNPDTVKDLYQSFVKTIDKAAGAGIVHKKTAARKKSRLAKRVNAILKSQS